jgi:hypothetical protein
MLFFSFFSSVSTANQYRSSPGRVEFISIFYLLLICCTLPTISHAYPFSSSLFIDKNRNNNEMTNNRHWTMSNESPSSDDNEQVFERRQRATGFYIVRQGEYFLLIPDSNHHFTKNIRPYIGRRR